MSFQEDFREFLDIDGGFAVDVLVIPVDGDDYSLRGIFSAEYVDIDAGFAGVSGNNPIFECAESDAHNISFGDILRIQGKEYRTVATKPDGNGWMVIVLEVQ